MRTEFVGRQDELTWLRSQFDACATRGPDGQYGGPRMAFVIAESGIGKSRLVQELYLQLTSDPRWDPPAVDYWPDAFKTSDEELHVVPDMNGHVAKGPPRFAWLGARWRPTDERNVLARTSILSGLRSSLTVHADILRAHQSLWQDAAGRVIGAIRHEGVGEVIGQLADSALPFGGLLLKIASGIKDIAVERRLGPETYEDVSKKAVLSDADEVLDCFRLLLDAKSAVPTVLWLDDAQWIDADTRLFLKRLWAEATRRRWPLLIVVTHWEREWRELVLAEAADSLPGYTGDTGVAELQLQSPPDATLGECLKSRLPGLTEQQAMLMIEKAAGNFLQLLENIGAISNHSRNFVNRNLQSSLTDEAEAIVRKYETDRERRVAQRFREFEEDVQDVLGWSSQFGQRFVNAVIESFAKERLGTDTAGNLIDRCVDPYVVLNKSSPFTREFRDKVFHRVADEYRHRYLLKDAERLSAVLRAHLVEWITNSVTPDGEIVSQPDEQGTRCIGRLPIEEQRDLLGIAVEEVRLPECPDWADPECKAALWAICMSIETDRRDALWGRAGSLCDRLRAVQWDEVPESACSRRLLDSLAETARMAGRLRVARDVAIKVLAIARRLLAEEETPERLRDVSVTLSKIGNIEHDLGQYDKALVRYEESLAIDRRLLAEEETPERLRDVSDSSYGVGRVAQSRGHYGEALARYEESLEIARRLLAEEETPPRLLDVSLSLDGIGRIEEYRGQYDEALAWYEEALAIRRRLLAEEEASVQLRYVKLSLDDIGRIEEARGQYDEALARYEESLAITRRLLAEEETPERLRDVSISLNGIGDIKKARGQYDEALAQYEELSTLGRQLGEAGHGHDVMAVFVWKIHVLAESLTEARGPGVACELLSRFIESAAFVEELATLDCNSLNNCAAFWESRAAAAEAVGEVAIAAEASQRAVELRQQIAFARGTDVGSGDNCARHSTIEPTTMSSQQCSPPGCASDEAQHCDSTLTEKFTPPQYLWPADICTAIDNPSCAFDSADLRSALPERGSGGLPRARYGVFGTVYKMFSPDSAAFALKVWSMHCADREERYRKISDYLTRRAPLRCLVPFEYRVEELCVLVDGHAVRRPVLKQDWVAGKDLYSWTRTRCLANDRKRILRVAEKWRHTAAELEANAVAHGDIEPSNILITDSDDIKLVDYDSMCVPSLACRRNLEVGREPYAHPQRDANTVLSRDIDNFALLFIFLALRALAAQPELLVGFVETRDSDKLSIEKFVKTNESDKLLIEKSDLDGPDQSALCTALRKSPDPEVRALLENLISFYRGDINEVPSLSSIVSH